MPTGLVTVDVKEFTDIGVGTCKDDTCPDVSTFQGTKDKEKETSYPVLLLPLTLRLLGNAGQGCGFGKNETCPIDGVALCRNSPPKKATIAGPLKVESPGGPTQADLFTNVANLRFQVDGLQVDGSALCGSLKDFQSFVAREGHFVACVSSDKLKEPICNRQFCTVNLDDLRDSIKDDGPVVYNCRKQP
jgi:hypothetical protein